MRGLTFYICFGKYAGFHCLIDSSSARMIFGWVSFCVVFYDIECVMGECLKVVDAVIEGAKR